MKVFKFGGASLKTAAAVKNVAQILKSFDQDNVLVVVSAMGKTTNALEEIVELMAGGKEYSGKLNELFAYHLEICRDLFDSSHGCFRELEEIKTSIINQPVRGVDLDQLYDQVVSCGEIISSRIVTAYFKSTGLDVEWLDARKFVATDNSFREGKVDWNESARRMATLKMETHSIWLTQGFIGGAPDNFTTTLGREGSDYTAAIFASLLNAESVTIWKDVPGVMSADPKRIPNAATFDELPFKEAAEMTYYGASVIHPKTIKPLANKNIPLLVKNFDDITLPGTRIYECKIDQLPPLVVFKENQCLISCRVTDYTFIDESQIGVIFNALSSRNLKVNLMQNSAISFSFCLDFNERKVIDLIEELGDTFDVYYNVGLTLITIKNYDEASFEEYRRKEGVILEQSSRSTLQVLIKA